MWPGTALIHQGRCNGPVIWPFLDFLCYLFVWTDRMLIQPFYINPKLLRLANLQLLLLVLLQQVPHCLVVDLHHADHHFKILGLVCVRIDLLEYLVTHDRYYSSVSTITYHRVWLARTCLSVCEETTVVSLPTIDQYSTKRLLKCQIRSHGTRVVDQRTYRPLPHKYRQGQPWTCHATRKNNQRQSFLYFHLNQSDESLIPTFKHILDIQVIVIVY